MNLKAFAKPLIGFVLFAVANLSQANAAVVVNVNYGNPVINGTAYNGDGTVSPIAYSGTTWNEHISVASPLSLNDSLGNSTGFTLSSLSGGIGDTTATANMLKGLFYAGGAANFTLSGLNTDNTYNLYIATYHPGSGGSISLGGDTKTINKAQSATFADGINYVSYAGVSPNGGGQITFTANQVGGYAIVNGFQLEVVPEPATTILLGIGLMTLFFRRQRLSY